MKSRMDRYYSSTDNQAISTKSTGRSARNQDLYKKKDYNIYSSNEMIIDTNNEVDISKIKNIIKSREDYQRAKSYRSMLNGKNFDLDDVEVEEETYEEKDYDINTLLQKVKENKNINNEEDKVRKLRNTQYDILSKLDVKSKDKVKTEDAQKEELQDLINTITHKENDTMADLLDDLKGENTTIIKAAEELEKERELTKTQLQATIQKKEQQEAERDFYSDSFTFSKRDFEGFQDLESSVKSNNKLIKVLIFILVVIILTVALFVADSFFDFIPFF